MSPLSPGRAFAERVATRLKFPQLFAVLLGLFLFDLIVPDFVPFVDEILLGLGAALFGMWREPVPRPAQPAPMKNVTPPKAD
ncbi:MAG: hypothetical protein NDJ75_11145 [Thermoanaerobaculia bacterium]|nr:hypothetical protein [Thermoanaerobaculia bacterium]